MLVRWPVEAPCHFMSEVSLWLRATVWASSCPGVLTLLRVIRVEPTGHLTLYNTLQPPHASLFFSVPASSWMSHVNSKVSLLLLTVSILVLQSRIEVRIMSQIWILAQDYNLMGYCHQLTHQVREWLFCPICITDPSYFFL